jgi:hypothetical protein
VFGLWFCWFVDFSLVPCVVGKVQGNQVGLKLNGTHQLLSYGNGMNLLGENVDII